MSSAQAETSAINEIEESSEIHSLQLEIHKRFGTLNHNGGTRGGGGGVVKRDRDGNIIRVHVLDLYRAEKNKNWKINDRIHEIPCLQIYARESTESEDQIEKCSNEVLDFILNLIRDKNPPLYSHLLRAKLTFFANPWISVRRSLGLIDDFGKIELQKDEELQTIIERRIHRFLYKKDLYQRLSSFERALLKLHEFIYMISDHVNSRASQEIVAYLTSAQLPQDNKTQVLKKLDEAGLYYNARTSGLDNLDIEKWGAQLISREEMFQKTKQLNYQIGVAWKYFKAHEPLKLYIQSPDFEKWSEQIFMLNEMGQRNLFQIQKSLAIYYFSHFYNYDHPSKVLMHPVVGIWRNQISGPELFQNRPIYLFFSVQHSKDLDAELMKLASPEYAELEWNQIYNRHMLDPRSPFFKEFRKESYEAISGSHPVYLEIK